MRRIDGDCVLAVLVAPAVAQKQDDAVNANGWNCLARILKDCPAYTADATAFPRLPMVKGRASSAHVERPRGTCKQLIP